MKAHKLHKDLWPLEKEKLVQQWNYVKRRVGEDENYSMSFITDSFIAPVVES